MRRDLCNESFPDLSKKTFLGVSHFVFKVGFFVNTMSCQLQKRRGESHSGSSSSQWEATFNESNGSPTNQKLPSSLCSTFLSIAVLSFTKEFRVVTSGFQVLRGNLTKDSKYFQPRRENPLHCILKQLVKKLNLSKVLAEPVPFLPICTVVQLVGFGCAAQPCAARTHTLSLTGRRCLLSAHHSFLALFTLYIIASHGKIIDKYV
jgi:hypothetical protein